MTGLPKNDMFFTRDDVYLEAAKKIHNYYKLDMRTKILLYAPTHRHDGTMLSALNIEYENLKNWLCAKFGGKWHVLIRLHPSNIKEQEI